MVLVIYFIYSIFFSTALAQDGYFCLGQSACEYMNEIKQVGQDMQSRDKIVELIKVYSLRQNTKSVEFDLTSEVPESWQIRLVDRPTVNTIQIIGIKEDESDLIRASIPLRENDVVNDAIISEIKTRVADQLRELGSENPKFKVLTSEVDKENKVNLTVEVDGLAVQTIKKIQQNIDQEKFPTAYKMLQSFIGRKYIKKSIQIDIDRIEKELIEMGYVNSDIEWNTISIDDRTVGLDINVKIGGFHTFYFDGIRYFTRFDLLSELRKQIKDSNLFNSDLVQKIITDLYRGKGFYQARVNVRVLSGQGDSADNKYYFVNVVEGRRIRLKSVEFSGNYYLPKEDVVDLFKLNATDLVENDYYDQEYLNRFPDLLRKKYRSLGYLLAEVSPPQVRMSDDGIDLVYNIIERQQTNIDKISFSNLSPDLLNKLKDKFALKEGMPFDVTVYEEQVKMLIKALKDDGYYFATIKEENLSKTLSYSKDLSRVQINLNFMPGYKTHLGKLIISGLSKTKDFVVSRENRIEHHEVVTPQNVEELRLRIESLNLFSNIRVNLINLNPMTENDAEADLLISVVEKDFGYGEIAPGYRTDLGLKLSTSLSYSNIFGINHGFGFKLQVNQRLDFSYLDPRRSGEERRLLEVSAEGTYRWPYLFNFMDFFIDASAQRKRFYAFDADIAKFSPRLHKSLNDYWSLGLQYQFEFVRPFDATEVKDRDSFRIGSITPSILYDRRDSRTRPTKGISLGLSYERASPGFGAQNSNDLKIDFYKIVSRNRAYFSLGHFTFAFYAAAGVEQNLATIEKPATYNTDGTASTIGYIPSIKVFRLDGVDTIRGFGESEINRLKSGTNINQVRVQGKAYFSVFKFEPRYSLTDTTILGVFFDAGRVSVDSFQPTDLRTSSGLSFKYVTPVGTLDFDYGVKLHRERFADGGRESFGRFHLSIGVF